MRVITALLLSLYSLVLYCQTNSKHVYVKPYTRSDGTQVQGHFRTAPNKTNSDNFSTEGNVNPYTGQPGYIPSDNKTNYFPSTTYPIYNNPSSNYSNNSYQTKYTYDSYPAYNTPPKPINLSLSEMFTITNKANWDEVNDYLLNKGWSYYNSSKGDDSHYNSITWSYEKEIDGDKARGWFYLYTYEGYPNKLSFDFFNKPTYNLIKTAITNAGMKLMDNAIEDDKIVAKYSNANFIVTVITTKQGGDNSLTAYSITITKKASVFDNANGAKKDYDSDGNLIAEYTLKDNKINGVTKTYYPNGKLKVEANYLEGKRNGYEKEYDEDGSLTFESNYNNGELNGSYKIYENGKLRVQGNALAGKKNGRFVEYNIEGKIDSEYDMKSDVLDGIYIKFYYDNDKLFAKRCGFYSNDAKSGLWQVKKLKEKGEEICEYCTYVNGSKSGPFKEVKGDSIIFGNYTNGNLEGKYKVYRSLVTMIAGGYNADTTNAPLTATGYYSDGQKTGRWNFYSLSKGVRIAEGNFYNDVEDGEWKYYFDIYSDSKGRTEPFSNKLYLIENYEYGKKNGKEVRYADLKTVKIPCDTTNNSKVNPLDTCSEKVFSSYTETSYYKSGNLHGPFEKRDTSGVVLFKGNFINGKKDGSWLESYFTTDYRGQKMTVFLEGNYVNGLEEGKWNEYVNKNCVYTVYSYTKGKLDGTTIDYDCNKVIKRSKYFDNGKFKNLDVYDSTGTHILNSYDILSESTYSYKCKATRFNNGEKYSQEYTIIKESETPINDRYFELIFLLRTGKNSDGKSGYEDGEFKLYNKKGELEIEGVSIKNKRQGSWKYYYYDQNILKEQNFNDDVSEQEHFSDLKTKLPFSGTLEQYHANGKIKQEIRIKDGVRDGKSKYFDEDGKLTVIEKYRKGLLEETIPK